MEEENLDTQESLIPAEGEETSKTSSEESAPEPDKRDELINNYKVRAERAEKENKALKAEKGKKEEDKDDIGAMDILALAKANLPDEDIKMVREWAKFKGITVAASLNDSTIKFSLAQKAEERKSAEAANTKSPRGTSHLSPDAIHEKARQGELPESREEIDAITAAKFVKK